MAFSNTMLSASHSPITPRKISPKSVNVPHKVFQPSRISTTNSPHLSIAYPETIAHNHHKLVSKPLEDYMLDSSHIKHLQKVKEVRSLLCETKKNPIECLNMVDELQRLGIDYHFKEEINAVLSKHHSLLSACVGNHNLHDVALCFRLLRQYGYNVPADVFNNFKDLEGKFKVSLSKDIKGIMGLYEASHLGLEGEHILDEANDFASKHLNASMTLLDQDLARAVGNALEHPFHKSLARFKIKDFLKNSQQVHERKFPLTELAKMDFNIVQSVHHRELLEISQWWKDLALTQELMLARDQPLKWYVWSMAMLKDPKYSEQRIELTKPISLIYVIDDIFDVYGALDELVLFTDAVNKWELADIERLPNYMKTCFKAIYDISNEISCKVLREFGWDPINSLRKTWGRLFDAFLVEAKWFAAGHVPKADEYLMNGIVSSGVDVVMVHMFFLLGEGITKETVDIVENMPGLFSCPATILRLWDDLGSAKDENQDGNDGSYIECYMKEHNCSSIGSAKEHTVLMISNAWKQLNEDCLLPSPFSQTFKEAALNLARMVRVMYSYDDNQRLPTLEKHIKSLLYENIPL